MAMLTLNSIPKATTASNLQNSNMTDNGTTVSIGNNISFNTDGSATIAGNADTPVTIDANGNLTANTLTGTIDLNNILPDGTGIYWGTGSGSLVDTHITTNGGGALGAVSFALNGGTISGSIILALNSGNSLKIDNVGNIISSRILAATSDPHVAGQLYNLSGVVMVSSG